MNMTIIIKAFNLVKENNAQKLTRKMRNKTLILSNQNDKKWRQRIKQYFFCNKNDKTASNPRADAGFFTIVSISLFCMLWMIFQDDKIIQFASFSQYKQQNDDKIWLDITSPSADSIGSNDSTSLFEAIWNHHPTLSGHIGRILNLTKQPHHHYFYQYCTILGWNYAI